MLPDTQYSSESFPQVFNAQRKWVNDNQASRNIRYMLHVGDVVDDSDQTYQWRNATMALGAPSVGVPYIVGVGNHDMDAMPQGQDPAVVRGAAAFNDNFPRSEFASLPSFGGTMQANQNDDSYHTFSAGGVDWLVLALKYAPTDAEIAWGNQVVAAHPNHKIILVTHAYQSGTTKDANGRKLWTNLVSKYANFQFVFSGHYVAAGVIQEKGVNGNTVYQIQADYQNALLLGPNSYLRVMLFNPTNKTVTVQTYSPYLNRYMTDSKNQFVLNNVSF